MFHIELRQFPHNACHFNLSEPQLRSLVLPWVREEWIEIGERKWNPNQAKLTIVEGPELPLDQLTMGRGWRHAEREGQDVTERLFQAARKEVAAAEAVSEKQVAAQGGAGDPALLADSLGLELLALLDDGPAPLARVWLLAGARLPGSSASECLALAERAVVSLLARRLVSLRRIEGPGAGADGEGAEGEGGGALADEQVEVALRVVESWSLGGESGALLVCRG